MRTAIINNTTGLVELVLMLDSPSLPEGYTSGEYTAVESEEANVGSTFDGTAFLAPVEKVVIPPTVTPRQARLALLGAGLLDKVQAAVDAAGGTVKITWEYATVVDRHDPMIAAVAASLGLSDQQLDALFTQASNL